MGTRKKSAGKKGVEFVKKNGVVFRVYQTAQKTFLAAYHFAGEKGKIHRANREALESAMSEAAGRLAGSHLGQVNMSALEWQEFVRARGVLAPFNVSIVDAAQHYARTFAGVRQRVKVAFAVEGFKAAKKEKGVADSYARYIKNRLKWLADEHGEKHVSEVSADDIKAFMRRHGTQGAPYNRLAELLMTFWRWCRAEGYFPKGEELPPSCLEERTEFDEEPSVFSPAQLRALLAELAAETKPRDWVMLGAFFGLRVAEVLRLIGADVQVAHKVIEVKAQRAGRRVAKTGQRRLVEMPDNLLGYCEGLAERKVQWGEFVQSHVREAAQRVKAIGGWPKNVLRHSAISYRYALTGDIARTAAWAGTSTVKIEQNYRALRTLDGLPVTKELAGEWFKLGGLV